MSNASKIAPTEFPYDYSSLCDSGPWVTSSIHGGHVVETLSRPDQVHDVLATFQRHAADLDHPIFQNKETGCGIAFQKNRRTS